MRSGRVTGWKAGVAVFAAVLQLAQGLFASLAAPTASAVDRLDLLLAGSLCVVGDPTGQMSGAEGKMPGGKPVTCCTSDCPMVSGHFTPMASPRIAERATFVALPDATPGDLLIARRLAHALSDARGPPARA